jgi:hypothetical protein
MGDIFGRDWGLEVIPETGQATLHEGMHMRFNVLLGGSSPGATVEISNPSYQLIGDLRSPRTIVRILAGYGEQVEVARGGIIRDSLRDLRDDLQPRVALQISSQRPIIRTMLCEHVAGPVTTSQLIEHVRLAMAIPADVVELGEDITHQRGHTLEGSAVRAITDLAEESGSQWSIHSGRLRVWPRSGRARTNVVILGSRSGLQSANGGPTASGKITVTARLLPAMRPGDRLEVRSSRWSGEVVAREVQHQGDTEGDAWTTTVVGRVAS